MRETQVMTTQTQEQTKAFLTMVTRLLVQVVSGKMHIGQNSRHVHMMIRVRVMFTAEMWRTKLMLRWLFIGIQTETLRRTDQKLPGGHYLLIAKFSAALGDKWRCHARSRIFMHPPKQVDFAGYGFYSHQMSRAI